MLIAGVWSCQEGYTRYSAELTCTQRDLCHYEFKHEIMFNSVMRVLCIELHHGNSSVGYVKVQRKQVRLRCTKESLAVLVKRH